MSNSLIGLSVSVRVVGCFYYLAASKICTYLPFKPLGRLKVLSEGLCIED